MVFKYIVTNVLQELALSAHKYLNKYCPGLDTAA